MVRYIIVLLFCCASTFAIEPHGEFHVGVEPESNNAYTYVLLEFVQGPVMLYGSWRTWFEFNFPSAYPFRDIYTVGARVNWNNVFLDIQHFCNHPVWSRQERKEWLNNKWSETITTVSVGVRW